MRENLYGRYCDLVGPVRVLALVTRRHCANLLTVTMAGEFNSNTVMLAKLNQWLNAVPFIPFQIVTSSGKTYEVPSPDHLTITRLLKEILVERDDGSGA